MTKLELEKVVLNGFEVHKHPLTEPILPDGGHWKVELAITVGATRYSIHRIIGHPLRMTNAVKQLALTVGGMLHAILSGANLLPEPVGNRAASGETVNPYDHSVHP